MRRCSHTLQRDGIVRQVFREAERYNVVRHRRCVRPYAFELVAWIGDVGTAASSVTAGGAGRNILAILRLDGRPGRAADILQERSHIVLQLLAGETNPVRVRGGETDSLLRAPKNQVDRRLGLHADRPRAGVAAVVNQVAGERGRIRKIWRAYPPEDVLLSVCKSGSEG